MRGVVAIFEIVKIIIDEWNPYGLLPEAPADEFDIESRRIAEKISSSDTTEKIARIVSSVFSQAFEPQYFGYDACYPAAEKIKQEIDKE